LVNQSDRKEILFSEAFWVKKVLSLTPPVMLADWEENLRFILAIMDGATVSSKELTERPYIEMALYCGSHLEPYVRNSQLNPQQANQKGKLYPAIGEAGPVIELEVGLPRRLNAEGVNILVKHGIPDASG
jgi:hypothetical protein